jgi:fumarate hydratase class II
VFASRLIRDLDVDRGKLEANVAGALLLATALNPVIGYDKGTQITAKHSATA